MATGIEDGIKIVRRHVGELLGIGKFRGGGGIGAEAFRGFCLIFGQITFRIKWWLAALWRSERNGLLGPPKKFTTLSYQSTP